MKELSIFIDESGDFGPYDYKSPYYIISMVVHDQSNDISPMIQELNNSLENTLLCRDYVHVGPLIRRENEYSQMNTSERLQVLRRFVKFTSKVNFSYKTFYIEKKYLKDDKEIISCLARQLSDFLKEHYSYFQQYDILKLYYDHGQDGVLKIILTVFTTLFNNIDYKNSRQNDYKMLQIADLVCTTELIRLKAINKSLSRSERGILGSDKEIRKLLLRALEGKRFRD